VPVVEPVLNNNAIQVLRRRYLLKNDKGEVVETPKELFSRVAKAVARADIQYGEDPTAAETAFYNMMARLDFLPNTPCLANAGRVDGQLSACFVLPIEDRMDAIMDTAKNAALVHKTGGGTGFSYSRIRPRNDFVAGTGGAASGPVSFMRMYNAVTECVKQAGIRRGANMGILRVDHPDILEFIDCKRVACDVCSGFGRKTCGHGLTNFNISVGITDAFMKSLYSGGEYEIVHPVSGSVVGKYQARDVWDRIIQNAHYSGEPGLFFIDRVNALDPLSSYLGDIEATNPCGEVPLRAYDACTLGSVNLSKFYFERDGVLVLDFDRLASVVHHCVHFLDNVLTINNYPVPQIGDMTRKCRKIGIGVMGWADLLLRCGIPYDSDQALKLGVQTMRLINEEAVKASEVLAEKRGPFEHWSESRWAARGDKPRRNSTVTVIAPTGSISIIAGCSSGIEPLFSVAMIRNQADMEMVDVNQVFVDVSKREGWYSEDLMREVAEKGSVSDLEAVPKKWREVFRTSLDIRYDWHVKMQAAFQAHVEDAVSKTINMPNTATVEDVEAAYDLAWELGCKGITVYRDGSRKSQVLNVGKVNHGEATKELLEMLPKARRHIPADGYRHGTTISKKTAHGTVHTVIDDHPEDGQPFECFIISGKSGSEVTAVMEALGRAVSYALAIPSPIRPDKRLEALAEQLRNIGGASNGFGLNRISSAPDGVGQAFQDYLARRNGGIRPKFPPKHDLCPQCKAPTLSRGGGCDVCESCGYSKC